MQQLLDLYGFVTVVLHAGELVGRAVLGGAIVFWTLLVLPLLPRLSPAQGAPLERIARRGLYWGVGITLAFGFIRCLLAVLALATSLDISIPEALGADFVRATALGLLAALAALLIALPGGRPGPARRIALLVCFLALLLATVFGTHAASRTEDEVPMLIVTMMHHAGAALWLGGLPMLLASLKLPEDVARQVGRRYSVQAATGVGLIVVGIIGFWFAYLQSPAAVYGTAYGAMSATKGAMMGLLLLIGLGNFLVLHRTGATSGLRFGLRTVRRAVECEIAIGLAVLSAAASITSLPPASDLTTDRVSWHEIVERFTPEWPRLSSPDHADLAIPELQAKLDAEWKAQKESNRPQAFVPGDGELPPRNADDIAWSEYNHHWAGLAVLLVGLAALLDATGRVRIARHWPLLFLLLAAFLMVRSDPEVWPLGDISLMASLRDPEVVQHRLAALLVVAFAVSEWAVRLGLSRGRLRLVFPLAMIVGSVLLLLHNHAISNVKDQLLIEWSHLPLAVLALIAGCARWVEMRTQATDATMPAGGAGMGFGMTATAQAGGQVITLPLPETGLARVGRVARWIWPVCLTLIGVLLLLYREA